MSAGAGPVQTDGQPAQRAPPGPQEEVQGAYCEPPSKFSYLVISALNCFFLFFVFLFKLNHFSSSVSGWGSFTTARKTQPGKSLPLCAAVLVFLQYLTCLFRCD